MIGPRGVETLKRQRPEWSPWLAVVEEALKETKDARWDAAVPERAGASDRNAPLLAGTTIVVNGAEVRRLLQRLVDVAARNGTPKMTTAKFAVRDAIDTSALFRASICLDTDQIESLAEASGADAEALQGITALLSVPLLHACQRRWAAVTPRSWIQGYCPICGSWPAFAEMRGIERSRHFRCNRCGGEWHAQILHCAYCGNSNHDDLVTLVPDTLGSRGAVEACRRCRGYVKVFTTLQGCPPESVMLEDLGSVDLDVAALEQDYTRPSSPGYSMTLAVNATERGRSFFAWNGRP
jgi:FdhE protein